MKCDDEKTTVAWRFPCLWLCCICVHVWYSNAVDDVGVRMCMMIFLNPKMAKIKSSFFQHGCSNTMVELSLIRVPVRNF